MELYKDRPGMNDANIRELEEARQRHIGESKRVNDGRIMTITDWRGSKDITVIYSDGQIQKTSYSFFKKRKEYDPSHPGEKIGHVGDTAVDKYGNVMTILEYNNLCDITVSVCGMILHHKQMYTFNNPNTAYKEVIDKKNREKKERKAAEIEARKKRAKEKYNSVIGMTVTANNGMKMTCLSRNKDKVDVQFEDGTIVKDRNVSAFKRGAISNPSCPDLTSFNSSIKDHTGETAMAVNGLWMKILSTTDRKRNTIIFEDGETVERSYRDFKDRQIGHPCLKSFGFPYIYHGITVTGKAFSVKNAVFYYIKNKDGSQDLMTPQEMLEKAGIKPAFLIDRKGDN